MKIYHDHNEDGTWTEITTIKQYPSVTLRMDETSQINFIINDFEGALYSTWSGYNFIPILITDGTSAGPPPTNIIFRGYLTGKTFKHNQLSCTAHGLSVRMDWIPLKQNYILAEGVVKTVPYAGAIPSTHTVVIRPGTDDIVHNWSAPVGTAWSTVDKL